ncbi:MAG: hypothetical protein IKT40_03745 [Bacilli bacterium]|nr:hypothetical protein [Bacilli bacterium]
MSKKLFWIRLISYAVIGGGIPLFFLIWRFNLFSKVSKLSIGGWGMVAILFIGIFFIKMMKAIRKGLPFSFGTQILEGMFKVTIPLLIATVIIYVMRNSVEELFQFFFVLLFCETIAMIVNPIPQWAHENKIEEQESSAKRILSSLGFLKTDDNK